MANETEALWNHDGLDCHVVMTDMGHRCGYVRIPPEHPFFGLSYNDPVPLPVASTDGRTIEETGIVPVLFALMEPEEWSRRMEAHVRVHGGLTYAGRCGTNNEWWIGFDCAHVGDDPREWTLDRVKAEVEKMAAQVAALSGGG